MLIIGIAIILFSCKTENMNPPSENEMEEPSDTTAYPGVPKSSVYEVTITREGEKEKLTVFQNTCPETGHGICRRVLSC